LPEAAPENQTKDVSTSEKKTQFANALPAGPLEAAPKTAEPGCGTANDAAQQIETGNKS
jgi:hypothetical protein